MHPPCTCTHPAADHHLDGMAVECWGELATCTHGEHVDLVHCDCTVYQPAMEVSR